MTIKITHAQAATLAKVSTEGTRAISIGARSQKTLDVLESKGYIASYHINGVKMYRRIK